MFVNFFKKFINSNPFLSLLNIEQNGCIKICRKDVNNLYVADSYV